MYYRTIEDLRCENPCLYRDITKWIADYNIQNADDAAIVALANIIERCSSRCSYPSYRDNCCYPIRRPRIRWARPPACGVPYACVPVPMCVEDNYGCDPICESGLYEPYD